MVQQAGRMCQATADGGTGSVSLTDDEIRNKRSQRPVLHSGGSQKMPHLRLFTIITIFTCGLFAQIEPNAATWRTWVVPSVSDLRLPPPPTGPDAAADLQALKDTLAE